MSAPQRLNKVLKELNISMQRAVDYLQSKDIDVDARPNTKIDSEVYDILVEEFQTDMDKKQKSEIVSQKKKEEKEKLKAEREEKEESTPKKEEELIKGSATTLSGPKMVGKIDLDAPRKTAVEEEAPKAEEKKEEAAELAEAPEPKKEEPKEVVAEKPAAEPKAKKEKAVEPEKKEVKAEAPKPEKKVAKKKTAEKKEAPVQEEPKKEEVVEAEVKKTEEAIPVKEAEVNAEETPKEVDAAAGEATNTPAAEGGTDNRITTKFQKLSGPKFTGEKVDLSKFERSKKKVASSVDNKAAANSKRKRKRISPTGTATPSSGVGRPPRGSGPLRRGPGGRKPEPKAELTDEQIQKQIKETLEKLTGGGKKSKGAKFRREKRAERKQQVELDEIRQQEENKIIKVTEFVTVSELAIMMEVDVNAIISACMSLGMMVTMNQRLDAETLSIVAEEFGYEVEFVSSDVTEAIEEVEDDAEDLLSRAPIVTVMGHVDHGKTSLLDYVRKANVIAGESGGITQHIGAYSVQLDNGQQITFLDTPGHEAFTAMRARGAKVTDIAIIVIAADDDVMPQTKEAISHAQAAQVPIIFAINKVDLQHANPDKIKEKLGSMNLLVEDWGGTVQSQDISAKTGMNVQELLEKVLLEAELLELKANPKRDAKGTIVEASLDKGRGYVTTILVQNGTLRVGDYVLAGQYSGKVRAMLDERGQRVQEAGPSRPVSILGLDGAPQAGDTFMVMQDEKEAKNIAAKRTQLQREQSARTQKNLTLEEIGRRLAVGDFKELNVIVKGDVDGSIEALADSLQKLSTDEIQVNIIHKAVGQISESDILLASASDAIIVGFQVRPSANARRLAEKEAIDIRLYSIIYDAINEIKDAMEGMLSSTFKEEIVCNIEIRETFKISKVGTIAGCFVLDGTVNRNTMIRVIRDGVVVYTGELGSLKRFKDDVKEVKKGYECGLNIKNFNDIKVGDIVEGYEQVEVKRTLS